MGSKKDWFSHESHGATKAATNYFLNYETREIREKAVAFCLSFCLCVGWPSHTLRVSLLAASRPAAVFPHQASLVVDTALDWNDGLDMPTEEPFQFRERSGEKSLVLLCSHIVRTVCAY